MKQKYPKIKLSKRDKLDILHDIMALQEVAKRIWGDVIYIPGDYDVTTVYAWQWHLEKIISSKDPKKALKLHLNEQIHKEK